MTKKVLLCLVVCLVSCISLFAQNAPNQPMTFWYEYSVNPGKEAQFLELVKTVGQPVRDKLLAEGVIYAWGVQTPLLRVPGNITHAIWYAAPDWAAIEKVDKAMAAQIAKLDAEGEKPATGKKGSAPAGSVTARLREIVDISKTHDYVTRDIVFGLGSNMPKDTLPFTRYNFVKVKPGKAGEYRKAWEKYNKPVLDKLVADGTVLVYGLGPRGHGQSPCRLHRRPRTPLPGRAGRHHRPVRQPSGRRCLAAIRGPRADSPRWQLQVVARTVQHLQQK